MEKKQSAGRRSKFTHQRAPVLKQGYFRISKIGVIAFILITVYFISFFSPIKGIEVSGSSPPIGTCPPSLGPNATVTVMAAPLTLANISCVHSGSLTINGSGTVNLVNFSLTQTAGNFLVNVGNATLNIVNSTLSFNNDATVWMTAINTVIYGSRVTTSNSSVVSLGGVPNFLPRSAVIPSSSVTIISSTISSVRGQTSSPNLNIYAASGVNIVQSTISLVSQSASSKAAVENVGGGNISMTDSNMVSSSMIFFGNQPATSSSVLTITSNSTLNIQNSQLEAGQTSPLGYYSTSSLQLSSAAGMAITNSLLRSVASGANMTLSNGSSQNLSSTSINLDHSRIQSGFANGRVAVNSQYGIRLEQSAINVSSSQQMVLSAYVLNATDSFFSNPLSFGNTLPVGNLYNCSIPGGSPSGNPPASFVQYGYLFVHVVTRSNFTPIANALVNVLNPSTNTLVYSSTTNNTGWAKISAMYRYLNAGQSKSVGVGRYVIQAFSGSQFSPQVQIVPNNTLVTSLSIGSSPTPSTITISPTGDNIPTLISTYSLQSYNVSINPRQQYLPSGNVQYLSVVSNAVPLNLRNNYTNSEFDFNTVGASGLTYTFIVVYPKNLSSAALGVKVNGSTVQTLARYSNQTHDFVVFSSPSGYLQVAMTYISPIQIFSPSLPKFYPGVAVVAAVIVIGVVGSAFLVYYARRRNLL